MDEPSRIHAIHLLTLLSNPNSESMHYISHLNMFRYMFASTLGKIIFMEMRSLSNQNRTVFWRDTD